jgi:hypothetical protein
MPEHIVRVRPIAAIWIVGAERPLWLDLPMLVGYDSLNITNGLLMSGNSRLVIAKGQCQPYVRTGSLAWRHLEMYSWEERLDTAILNNDIAAINRLLHASQALRKLDKIFMRPVTGKAKRNGRLHIAAYSNSVEAARLLIQYGEDVNSRNGVGDTPLHVAARHNAWETADLLISSGAQARVSNDKSKTPVDIALSCGNYNLAELLVLAVKQSTYG